ncbi:MAG: hypothetical protein V1796_09280 [Pseudomonadota bacterium]
MTEIDPKLSRLYREASTEGPPAALDAAVLAAARKQVAKPQRRERSSWSRWMAPASALATLVVAVSIAFLIESEQSVTIDDTAIRQIPPQPQSPPPASATESAKAKAAGSAAPEAAAKKEAPAAPAPAQAPAATLPAQAPVSRPAEAVPVPQPAAPAASAAEVFPAESRAKAAAPSAAAPKAATESNVAGDSAIGGLGSAAPAAPAAAGKLAPLRQQAMQRSPEAWLDEISRLKREGREKEAAEQLAEFRKAYPAYAVPESLRDLQ